MIVYFDYIKVVFYYWKYKLVMKFLNSKVIIRDIIILYNNLHNIVLFMINFLSENRGRVLLIWINPLHFLKDLTLPRTIWYMHCLKGIKRIYNYTFSRMNHL